MGKKKPREKKRNNKKPQTKPKYETEDYFQDIY